MTTGGSRSSAKSRQPVGVLGEEAILGIGVLSRLSLKASHRQDPAGAKARSVPGSTAPEVNRAVGNRMPGSTKASPSRVPREGLEPTLPHGKRILSPPRLPFRHLGS